MSLSLEYLQTTVAYVREATIGTLTVTDSVDVSEAEVTGISEDGMRGSYEDPWLTGTVTLTSGSEPAAEISLPAPTSGTVARGESADGSITLQDLHPMPATDADGNPVWRIEWRGADPGSDVEFNYEITKSF